MYNQMTNQDLIDETTEPKVPNAKLLVDKIDEVESEIIVYVNQGDQALENSKVDKVTGKGLSSNDFTTAEKTKLSGIASNAQVNLLEVTYSQLVTLRDNEELVAGAFYRITDYETTVTQLDTRSAGHLFDIIIQAISESELAEVGTAIEREEENYFANAGAKLGTWQVWYALENKKALFIDYEENFYETIYEGIISIDGVNYHRYYEPGYNGFYIFIDVETNDIYYGWSDDAISGNPFVDGEFDDVVLLESAYGVITRLIDEKFNDLRYDFKNIQIYLDENDNWFYTFDNNGEDASLGNNVYDNTIKGKHQLNVFKGDTFYSNTIGNDFRNNTIGNYFRNNTIGNYFTNNTIGNGFRNNTIGNGFNDNTIRNDFTNNTIGNGFNNNTIGNDFLYNTIGNYFYYNTIGSYYHYCQFRDGVSFVKLDQVGTSVQPYKNITIKAGVVGASSSNPLTIEDETSLRNKGYNIEISRSALGRVLMLWYDDNGVKTGKYKATVTTSAWADL